MKIFAALLTFFFVASSLAAETTLDVPDEVGIRDSIEVTWSSPDTSGATIRIYKQDDTFVGSSGTAYPSNAKAQSVYMLAPEEPGEYTVKFRVAGETLASDTITVVMVDAAIGVPESVSSGASFDITWSGPNNRGDYIGVAESGAAGGLKGASYVYTGNTKDGKASLTAPEAAGAYDIIYRTGETVLARESLQVVAVSASLEGPAEGTAGGTVTVTWQGPNNSGDYITLATRDSDPIKGASYRYTGNSADNAVTLIMPEQTGNYDLVYATKSKRILARSPVTVKDVTASLDAPEQVQGKLAFEVKWEGPGNHGDWIGIMSPTVEKSLAYRYVDPLEDHVQIVAPETPGDYQLVYRTRGKRELATRAITITPPAVEPGFVQVSRDLSKGFGDGTAIEVILDASGSMLQKQGDKRRIDIAKATLTQLIRDTIPAETGFAMRVFGNRESGSCRTDLDIPLGPLDPQAAIATIGNIQAMNLAKTPIGNSLALVTQDLAEVSGERIVILVTDGEETCDGDPALAIKQLRDKGWDIKVNIVGYAIEDDTLKETFKSWAALGRGQYLNATNANELATAITQAMETEFQIQDTEGLTVARGMTNGAALELPPGVYTVKYSLGGKSHETVAEITSANTTKVALP